MEKDKSFKRAAILYPMILIVVFGLLFAWADSRERQRVARMDKIDGLQLPEDTTVYLNTRIEANDINWVHCVVEKVVRCEQGLDWLREYMKEHNTVEQLEGVNVCPFNVLDCMNHYCIDWLEEPAVSEVLEDGVEKYMIINYWVYGARGKSQWSLLD